MAKVGYVYILKDDHFKRGVKIGKAMDVEKLMKPGLETMEENVDNLVGERLRGRAIGPLLFWYNM